MFSTLRNLFSSPTASQRYVAIDVETTGFSPQNGDRVIQLALSDVTEAVRLAQKRQTEWSLSAIAWTFNPQRRIPAAASRIHGIYDQDVGDADPFSASIDEISEFIGDAVLVAHNAKFDRDFVEAEFRRAGVIPPANRWVCTLELARERLDLRSYKLGSILHRLGLPHESAHDAAHDAVGAGALFAVLQFPVR